MSVCEGYTWLGGGTSLTERLAEARRHRRKQQAMCGRHMRKVEEVASLSLESQIARITERQADMEAKQDQRLESLASALGSLKEGMVREGLIAASPRSHRSHAASLQPSPEHGLHLRTPKHRPPPDIPFRAVQQSLAGGSGSEVSPGSSSVAAAAVGAPLDEAEAKAARKAAKRAKRAEEAGLSEAEAEAARADAKARRKQKKAEGKEKKKEWLAEQARG